MSPQSFLSSRSSHAANLRDEPVLVFPSTDTAPDGSLAGFGFAGDTSSALRTESKAGRISVFEDTGLIEDPGFEFDAEGNIVDLPRVTDRESALATAGAPRSRVGSDSGISARVREEHEAGLQGVQVRAQEMVVFDDKQLS